MTTSSSDDSESSSTFQWPASVPSIAIALLPRTKSASLATISSEPPFLKLDQRIRLSGHLGRQPWRLQQPVAILAQDFGLLLVGADENHNGAFASANVLAPVLHRAARHMPTADWKRSLPPRRPTSRINRRTARRACRL